MKKVEWKETGGITLESAAIEAVKCEENALIIAGPGAGKTELLAQKAGYLFTTDICKMPKKILAISFKKDAADNLKKRIISRYGEQYKDRFISLTYDAFFKSILDRFYRALPDDYSINSEYEIADLNQQLNAFVIAGYHELNNVNKYDARKRASDILEKSNLPIRDQRLKRVWNIMLHGADEFRPAISFQMIAKLSLLIIRTNPFIKLVIQATFSYVFLDEFQDTTSIQYEIVKELFENTSVKLTAVGDNKQRIMLWAGARKTIFEDFYKDFNAKSFKLIMNHRSAPRLIELQKNMYASLNDNSDNIISSTEWSKDDGIINLIIADNNNVEAEIIAQMIERDIKHGIKPNDIAILCKQKVNDYAEEIITVLSQTGIRARIENDYQDLIKDEIIKIILSIILLSFDRKRPEEWEYIESISEHIFGIEGAPGEKYSKMLEELECLFNEIQKNLSTIDSVEKFCLVRDNIIDFFGEDRIKAMFPENKQGTYFRDKLSKFSELFWEEIKISNNDWELAVQGFKGDNSIPIMTIHKSKGLEYDSVYFIGLEDSAFWNFRNQPEEDRCAFFVALSRAKRNVTFTYCSYRYNFKYSKQKRTNINEFYDLLRKPGLANIIYAKEEEV